MRLGSLCRRIRCATYATPRIGWLWTLGPGFLLGFDFRVQFKIGGTVNVTVPPTASQKVKDDAQNLADLGSSIR